MEAPIEALAGPGLAGQAFQALVGVDSKGVVVGFGAKDEELQVGVGGQHPLRAVGDEIHALLLHPAAKEDEEPCVVVDSEAEALLRRPLGITLGRPERLMLIVQLLVPVVLVLQIQGFSGDVKL